MATCDEQMPQDQVGTSLNTATLESLELKIHCWREGKHHTDGD